MGAEKTEHTPIGVSNIQTPSKPRPVELPGKLAAERPTSSNFDQKQARSPTNQHVLGILISGMPRADHLSVLLLSILHSLERIHGRLHSNPAFRAPAAGRRLFSGRTWWAFLAKHSADVTGLHSRIGSRRLDHCPTIGNPPGLALFGFGTAGRVL